MSEQIKKLFNIEKKSVDIDNASLEAVFSTSNEDRHGDVVVQNWDLKAFKKNPVILNSHTYGDATEVIGKAEKVAIKDGKLEGRIKFAVNENPKAKIIFDLYANGFLNAFSVGFIPLEFGKKGEIIRSELLEVSAVAVPANAMALAKAKGIDVEQLYEETKEDSEIDGDTKGDEAEEDKQPADEGDEGEQDGEKDTEPDILDDEVEKDDEEVAEVEDDNSEDMGGESKPEVGEDEALPEVEDSKDEEPEVAEQVVDKQVLLLNLIVKAVKGLGEVTKVETPAERVRAQKKLLINKAIRELFKEKTQI